MKKLSFDLRGAGPSILLHAAGITALLIAPLFGSIASPEATITFEAPLIEPITVALPPAPLPPPPGPRPLAKATDAPAPVSRPQPPTDVPATTVDPDILDPGSLPPVGAIGDGPTVGTVVSCALGALCSDGPGRNTPQREIPRVGGFIKEPQLVESRPPQYPPIPQAAGASGEVVVEAHVSEQGRILEARVVRGHRLFDEAALASVRSRRYRPLLLNGVQTDFLVTITVVFKIKRSWD